MATLTIRNVPEDLSRALQERAAKRGVSVEQEAREALLRGTPRPTARRKPAIRAMIELGAKPEHPVDLKKTCDELWNDGLR